MVVDALLKHLCACAACLAALGVAAVVSPAQSQMLRESYVARLSMQDHFASDGVRITTPAGVLRQDRANFHRFGLRDAEDTGDIFFADMNKRASMERYTSHIPMARSVSDAIVNGTPLVRVSIYKFENGADYVTIEVQR